MNSSAQFGWTVRVAQAGRPEQEIFLVDKATIGRGASNHVVLLGDDVQGIHARFAWHPSGDWSLEAAVDQAAILDANSQPVRSLALRDGLSFRIGSAVLTVRKQQPRSSPAAGAGGNPWRSRCPLCHGPLDGLPQQAKTCPNCQRPVVFYSPDPNTAAAPAGTLSTGNVAFEGWLPRQVGPYTVRQFVATGGMGLVLRGINPKTDQVAAIKLLLHDAGADPSWAQRFVGEANVMRSVRHRHLVGLQDNGMDGRLLWLAMDWVEGQPLSRELAAYRQQGQPVAIAQIRDWLLQAIEGLTVLHAAGLVHRDLKPANLLLARDGLLKVADFGIAKSASGSGASLEHTALTGTGQAAGTFGYMAPEQATGGQIGPYSDVYALSVIWYELLCGHLPMGSAADPPIELRPDCPPSWSAMVMQGLKGFPGRRPLLEAMRAVVADPNAAGVGSASSVAVQPVAPPASPPAGSGRSSGPLLVAVLSLAAVAALAVGLWLALADDSSSDNKGHSPEPPVAHVVPPVVRPETKPTPLPEPELPMPEPVVPPAKRPIPLPKPELPLPKPEPTPKVDPTPAPETTPTEEQTFEVASLTATKLLLRRGDKISVSATGQVYTGPFIKFVGPEGRSTGLLGVSLEEYNIVREYPHACLMGRVGGGSWIEFGKQMQGTILADGELELQVNDREQDNNNLSHKFKVTVRVIRGRGGGALPKTEPAPPIKPTPKLTPLPKPEPKPEPAVPDIDPEMVFPPWTVRRPAIPHREGLMMPPMEGGIYSQTVGLFPDSRRAFSASPFRIWDLKTGKTLNREAKSINWPLYLSPDSRYLAHPSAFDCTIYSASTGTQTGTVIRYSGRADFCAWSPNSEFLAICARSSVIIWSSKSDKILHTLPHGTNVTAAVFSPDNQRLYTGSSDGTLRSWNTKTGEALAFHDGRETGLAGTKIAGLGLSIAGPLLGPGQLLSVWTSPGRGLWRIQILTNDVVEEEKFRFRELHRVQVGLRANCGTASSDWRYVITGESDGRVILWDGITGAELKVFDGHSKPVVSINVTADGAFALSCDEAGQIRLWGLPIPAAARAPDTGTPDAPAKPTAKDPAQAMRDFFNGKTYIATWTVTRTVNREPKKFSGRIGFEFSKVDEAGNVTGFLFDPTNKAAQKPFTGRLVIAEVGKVLSSQMELLTKDGKGISARLNGWTTANMLHEDGGYKLTLTFQNSGNLVGVTEGNWRLVFSDAVFRAEPSSGAATSQDEARAEGLWNLAEQLRKADKTEEEKKKLHDIIKSYPDTKTAQKARERLAELE